MDADTLARLRSLAEVAAQPEPPRHYSGPDPAAWGESRRAWTAAHTELRAALTPEVVLGLLDAAAERDRLREAWQACRAALEAHSQSRPGDASRHCTGCGAYEWDDEPHAPDCAVVAALALDPAREAVADA